MTSDLSSADADIENAIRRSMAKGQGGDARRLGMKTLHGQNQTRRQIGAEQEGARLAPTALGDKQRFSTVTGVWIINSNLTSGFAPPWARFIRRPYITKDSRLRPARERSSLASSVPS